MNTIEKNKQFIKRYNREMSRAIHQGPEIFKQTMHHFIKDQKLIDNILFFKKSFPRYDIIIKDMIAEGERVFVHVDFIGKHEGTVDGIPATHKEVVVPFALCYTIKEEKIVDFWAIANEMEFFEQLGLSRNEVDVPKSSETE